MRDGMLLHWIVGDAHMSALGVAARSILSRGLCAEGTAVNANHRVGLIEVSQLDSVEKTAARILAGVGMIEETGMGSYSFRLTESGRDLALHIKRVWG